MPLREVIITTTDPMPADDLGAETVVKTREALVREAERLKGLAVPVLDEKGAATGLFVSNIRTKELDDGELALVGDAPVPKGKKLSIKYAPLEETDGATIVQKDLLIEAVYYTDRPRNGRQDSMTSENEEGAAPAEDLSWALDELAETLSAGVPEETLEQLKGLGPRERITALKAVRAALSQAKPSAESGGGTPEGSAQPKGGAGKAPPVPVPTNTNAPKKRGPVPAISTDGRSGALYEFGDLLEGKVQW